MEINWTTGKVLIGILFFMLCFALIKYSEWSNNQEFPDILKKEHYKGVVVQKYLNEKRKSANTIVFADNSTEEIDLYYPAYDKIEIGDTLLKDVGTVKLVVKNGTKHEIFYPSYFGEIFYDSATSK